MLDTACKHHGEAAAEADRVKCNIAMQESVIYHTRYSRGKAKGKRGKGRASSWNIPDPMPMVNFVRPSATRRLLLEPVAGCCFVKGRCNIPARRRGACAVGSSESKTTKAANNN